MSVLTGSQSAQALVPAQPSGSTWVTDGDVYATALGGGKQYLAGSFTYIGPNNGHAEPLDAATGNIVANFPDFHGGSVNKIISDGSGGWYVGGEFRKAGAVDVNSLVHVLSDGTLDGAFDAQMAITGVVRDLAYDGSALYVAGVFSTIGGQSRNNVAALDPVSGAALSLNPNANGRVNTIALSGTTLYMGGYFTTIGSTGRNGMAAVATDTGTLLPWNPGMNGASRQVNAILPYGSVVYLGGNFSGFGATTRNRLAVVDAATGALQAWNPNPSTTVHDIKSSGTTLYVAGAFTSISGSTRYGVAAYDLTDPVNPSLLPFTIGGSNGNTQVYEMAISGSTMYVAGYIFRLGADSTYKHIGAIDTATGNPTSWKPMASSQMNTVAAAGGTVYVGGQAYSVGGAYRPDGLASVDLTTNQVTSFAPPVTGSMVKAMALSGDTLYVGGSFAFIDINGTVRSRLAAIDTATGLYTSWDPQPNGQVNAITVKDSRVYVGGAFSSIGGQPFYAAAAIDAATGAADPSFLFDPNGYVYSIVTSSDGSTVYLGGDFTRFNFTQGVVMQAGVAAVNASDGVATAFRVAMTNFPAVNGLALSGNTLYLGGQFVNAGGQARANFASVDATTGTLSPSVLGTDAGGSTKITSLALDGGTVYVGGNFTSFGGSPYTGLAAVDAATGNLQNWNASIGNDSYIGGISYTVNSLSASGGALLAGGSFNSVGGDIFHDSTLYTAVNANNAAFFGTYAVPQPTVEFTSASGSASESVTNANIPVVLSEAQGSPVTVQYSVTNGTATSGIDFTLASGTLTIPAGETATSIPFTVIDDSYTEWDESIVVTLVNPTGAILGANTNYTYTILENDVAPLPEVSFATSTGSGLESVSSAVISVQLSNTSASVTTVNYAVTGGTATTTDFVLADGTLTLEAGQTASSIPLTILGDSDAESAETIEITLSSPSGLSLGTTTVFTYTILDDDTPPPSGGGGGGGSVPYTPDPPLAIAVNGGAATTTTRTVALNLTAGANAVKVELSNTPIFSGAVMREYAATVAGWDLCAGTEPCTDGVRRVYARFYTASGGASGVYSDDIVLAIVGQGGSGNKPDDTKKNDAKQDEKLPQPATCQEAQPDFQPAAILFTKNLKPGDRDTEARALQVFLNQNGYRVAKKGAGAPGEETDFFGGLTLNALRDFQEHYQAVIEQYFGDIRKTGFLDKPTRDFINGTKTGWAAAACVTPVVDTTPGKTVTESAGTVSIPVILNTPTFVPVSVTVVLSGTATFGQDYTASTTVTIPPGSVTASLPVTIINDGTTEPAETVTVTVAAADSARTSGNTATVTVNDDDDETQTVPVIITPGSGSTGTVVEGSGGETVTVVLGGQPTGTITVSIVSTSTELAILPPTITFTPDTWNQPQVVTITAPDNGKVEGDRTVVIGYRTDGSQPGSGSSRENVLTMALVDAEPAAVQPAAAPEPVNPWRRLLLALNPFVAFIAVPLLALVRFWDPLVQISRGSASLGDLWLWTVRAFQHFLMLIGLRRKRRYWGTVYDSVTKQPLDPAIVTLLDAATGRKIDQSITDMAGRFGFMAHPGQYRIVAEKTHFKFPSEKVPGDGDDLFDHLYHGEAFAVHDESAIVAPNIPMDPLAFDWNQQDKQRIVKFHPTRERLLNAASNVLFWCGMGLTVIALVLEPTWGRILLTLLYILLFVMSQAAAQRLWGRAYRKQDGTALPGLLLELHPVAFPSVTIGKARTAQDGKFFLKAPENSYLLTVKTPDGAELYRGTVRMGAQAVFNKDIVV